MSKGSASAGGHAPAFQQESVQIDQQKQRQIDKYLRARRTTVSFITFVLIFPCFFFVVPAGNSTVLDILANPSFAVQPLANWYPLRLAIIYLYIAGVLGALLFPYAFFNSFLFLTIYKIRPRRFPDWLIGWLIGMVLFALRWLAFFELCYWLVIIQPDSWWIWATLVLSCINLGKSYILPSFLLTRFYLCAEITDTFLLQTLNELIDRGSRKTGVRYFLQIRRKVKDEAKRKELSPNGYLIGWGKTRSIVLTDGLLNNFAPAEIRSILAHELGHHVHHDISKTLLLNTVLLAGEMYVLNLIYHWFISLFTARIDLLRQAPFWFFLGYFTLYGVYLFKRAYSRRKEYQADEVALNLTGDVIAFKNAMIRLANMNSNPLNPSLSLALAQRHPSLQKRLKHADDFAALRQKVHPIAF